MLMYGVAVNTILKRHLSFSLTVFSPFTQAWASDEDDEPPFPPIMRKKAVKVKHVKRREKKFDKKVRLFSTKEMCVYVCTV